MKNVKRKGRRKDLFIEGPEGGWEPRTWYLVKIQCFASNPPHLNFFYSGFLDDGFPAGYNGAQSIYYADEEPKEITSLYSLKVIRKLFSTDELVEMGKE